MADDMACVRCDMPDASAVVITREALVRRCGRPSTTVLAPCSPRSSRPPTSTTSPYTLDRASSSPRSRRRSSARTSYPRSAPRRDGAISSTGSPRRWSRRLSLLMVVVVVVGVVVVVRRQVVLAPDAQPSAPGAVSWSVRRLQVRHARGPREATALGKSPRVTAACHRRVSPPRVTAGSGGHGHASPIHARLLHRRALTREGHEPLTAIRVRAVAERCGDDDSSRHHRHCHSANPPNTACFL